MQATAILVLLAVAVVCLLAPLPGVLRALAPPVLAGVALGAGLVAPAAAEAGIRPLLAPLAFVVAAVPMAVLLDRLGFFEELAARVAGGRRFVGALWFLAAVLVATLNLDAAVVLLTPLYVRIARSRGVSAFALGLQPALLSGLASSALPISNLTNLIVAGRLHLGAAAFVAHLGVPDALAVGVGWLAYRASYERIAAVGPSTSPGDGPPRVATARRLTSRAATGYESGRLRSPEAILAVGGAICVTVVAGFVVVPTFGGAPYEVAAGADLVLAALCARLPLRVLPVGSVLVVLGLGVLATGAAAHLPVPALLGDASPGGLARAAFASAAVANVMNNLPTVLVALPHLGERASWTAWAVLFGTNAGTLFVPSGSLAVLLWLATIRRLGLDVREQHYVRAAWMVAAPAFAAGAGALVLLRLVLGPSA